ncbi:hypothetical protein H4R34_003568 [Dimargaris verticillata]|uniref:WD40 repeat-like protein n=1 Tax=Dimargaris verticillata TaxID=2761393 RepID=A0A9W8EBW8_9FUNG|nr:hypothetical protein H4R34_003568 [Dimargaris verticillata]
MSQMLGDESLPKKEICNYFAPWPVYALDWSKRPGNQAFRLGVGSFCEQYNNKFQVVKHNPQGSETSGATAGMALDDAVSGAPPPNTDFYVAAEADHPYPVTKMQWAPFTGSGGGNSTTDLVATSGDFLRLWELVPSSSMSGATHDLPYSLQPKATLSNSRGDFWGPLTSFDWNQIDPSKLVTCSIDTTCTIWDINTQQPKTQLIAHDREVYDVAFATGSTEVFASAGADGSVRMFDLRGLEHSTIIYEAPSSVHVSANPSGGPPAANTNGPIRASPPLMRLYFNQMDSNYISTFSMDSSTVQILDARAPGVPVIELRGHRGCVNSLAWAPHQRHQLCSAGDDQQVLVWDLSPGKIPGLSSHPHQQPPAPQPSSSASMDLTKAVLDAPSLTYGAPAEVNMLSWSRVVPDWVAIGFGATVQALRV